MKLKPLSQWICDTCGDVIQEPRHGWFEWQWDPQMRSYGFRICHHNPNVPGYDPRKRRLCSRYNGPDLPLEDVSGAKGLPFMLSMLDVGEFRDPERSSLMKVVDIREWVFMCRRLAMPHFEEARFYFGEANSDGFFDGFNEMLPYTEETLLALIDRYGDK